VAGCVAVVPGVGVVVCDPPPTEPFAASCCCTACSSWGSAVDDRSPDRKDGGEQDRDEQQGKERGVAVHGTSTGRTRLAFRVGGDVKIIEPRTEQSLGKRAALW